MSNGEVDPRLCCAARVCCPPPESSAKARQATIDILKDMGLDDKQAESVTDRMNEMDIVFFPASVSRAITSMVSASANPSASADRKKREAEVRKALDHLAPPGDSNL